MYNVSRRTLFKPVFTDEDAPTCSTCFNQRTNGPENAHLKPDLGVLSDNEMTLTLNTHTPLLTS